MAAKMLYHAAIPFLAPPYNGPSGWVGEGLPACAILSDGSVFVCIDGFDWNPPWYPEPGPPYGRMWNEQVRMWHFSASLELLGTADISWTPPDQNDYHGLYAVATTNNRVWLYINKQGNGDIGPESLIIDCSGPVPVIEHQTPLYPSMDFGVYPTWVSAGPYWGYWADTDNDNNWHHVLDLANDRIIFTSWVDYQRTTLINKQLVQVFRASTGVLLSEEPSSADGWSKGMHMNPNDYTDFCIIIKNYNSTTGEYRLGFHYFNVPLNGSSVTNREIVSRPYPEGSDYDPMYDPVQAGSPFIASGGFINYEEMDEYRFTFYDYATGTMQAQAPYIGENYSYSREWVWGVGASMSNRFVIQCIQMDILGDGLGGNEDTHAPGNSRSDVLIVVDQLATPPMMNVLPLPYLDVIPRTDGSPNQVFSDSSSSYAIATNDATGMVLTAANLLDDTDETGDNTYWYIQLFLCNVGTKLLSPLRQRQRDDGLATDTPQQKGRGSSLQTSQRRGGRVYY